MPPEMVGAPPGKHSSVAILLRSACLYGRLPGDSTNGHIPTPLEGLQAVFQKKSMKIIKEASCFSADHNQSSRISWALPCGF